MTTICIVVGILIIGSIFVHSGENVCIQARVIHAGRRMSDGWVGRKYNITAEWIDPQNGKRYTFHWSGRTIKYISNGSSISVYINPKNPRSYHISL